MRKLLQEIMYNLHFHTECRYTNTEKETFLLFENVQRKKQKYISCTKLVATNVFSASKVFVFSVE